MKKIGMGGKYPAMVKPYHSMKNIPDKFFNWFSGKTGGKIIVHTKKQMNKQAKSTLINRIIFLEKLVFNLAYELYKSKLPRLRVTKQRRLPPTPKGLVRRPGTMQYAVKRKKRKARFRKGSPEAKRYMAKLRRMRK